MTITGYRLFKAGPLEKFLVPVRRVNTMYNPEIVTVDIVGNGTALFLCPFLKYEAPELTGGDKRITARVERKNKLEQQIN